MVKVFGDDGGWIYSSTLLNAAQQCRTAGCKIISMSLGGGAPSRTEDRGFQDLYNSGLLLVAAAGNAGNTTTSYPAGYASVISVAAVDSTNTLASFSQRNSDVEVAAPGVQVLSTVPYLETNTVAAGASGFSGNHVEFSARGTASAPLVNGGLATAQDPAWAGKIVLVERGSISFFDKVTNVQKSGGLACVIYNNVAGEALYATLGSGNSSTIPAIGLTQADGQSLLPLVGSTATVTSTVDFETSAWEEYDGTSMATPHVAAAAALVWSAAPAKSNTSIRTALTATAKDLGAAGRDTSFGYGLVQAKSALGYLVPPGGDTQAPVISNVGARVVNSRKGTFAIAWDTNEVSTTVVILNGTPYTNASLVTSHSMTFQGTKGVLYTYSVQSTDAAGNTAAAGPFTFQN
jgi:subtilisin family serine protease